MNQRDHSQRPKASDSGSSDSDSPISLCSPSTDIAGAAAVPYTLDFAALILQWEKQRSAEHHELDAQRRVQRRKVDYSVTLLGGVLAAQNGSFDSNFGTRAPCCCKALCPRRWSDLTFIPSFTCVITEDYDNYIRDFQGKADPQGYGQRRALKSHTLDSARSAAA